MLIARIAVVLIAYASVGSPQRQAATSTQKVTATGCVERADQVASSANTVGTTTDSLHFVLITPVSARGTRGSSSSGDPAALKGYRLEGTVDLLNPHVGHRVEVTGTITAPAVSSGTGSSFSGPLMQVQTIKMLSETCAR